MTFIDTDIFVIDKLFPKDDRYEINKAFLNEAEEKFTSVFNLFELLGIASFNLNGVELMKLFKGFEEVYGLKILYPSTAFISVNEFVENLFEETFQKIKLKMNFQDALILSVAEEYNCTRFVTWNTKHFIDRTYLSVQTPKEFLDLGLRDCL
ncbi:MAG: PIN domain-containing protein [Euryarchaeota archaeon]|nr:PIN domain-containing protein [Euryarchaeota archaeon]